MRSTIVSQSRTAIAESGAIVSARTPSVWPCGAATRSKPAMTAARDLQRVIISPRGDQRSAGAGEDRPVDGATAGVEVALDFNRDACGGRERREVEREFPAGRIERARRRLDRLAAALDQQT